MYVGTVYIYYVYKYKHIHVYISDFFFVYILNMFRYTIYKKIIEI